MRVTAAQIDLIGVRWLMIGEDPSSVPNGGSARGYQRMFALLASRVSPVMARRAVADLYIYLCLAALAVNVR